MNASSTHPPESPVGRDRGLHLLRQMLRIRRFEEKCVELYSATKIRGFLHLYIGEEAVAVGAIECLGPEDAVVATYREHGQALVRGVSPRAIMAEMYGKLEGCARGRGGSMHVFDAQTRLYGGNAIVGGGLPLAVGLALADKMQGRPRVTCCVFGDGAVAEGEFHESMNLAALWKLPVLFLCENNLYAMGTAIRYEHAVTELAKKANAYSVAAAAVDGMDVLAVEAATRAALDHVRSGAGPFFLECRTYRFRAHSMFDAEIVPHEVRGRGMEGARPHRRSIRPVEGRGLDQRGRLGDDRARSHRGGRRRGQLRGVRDLGTDRRSDPLCLLGEEDAMKTITYREAVREAIRDALKRDERVFLMGEDVGHYGGCFAVSKGLLEEFGPERIRDTPLSESAFVGAGIGAALGGMRPIVEIMTVNFSLLALDQIVNNAATLLHMSGGQFNVPLVIRMATGGGKQLAAQHSHSLEGWYAHIPGLRILAPATVDDARGMLWTALQDPDPVLIFENQTLYNMEGELSSEVRGRRDRSRPRAAAGR